MRELEEIKARLLEAVMEPHSIDWEFDMRCLIERVEQLESVLELYADRENWLGKDEDEWVNYRGWTLAHVILEKEHTPI